MTELKKKIKSRRKTTTRLFGHDVTVDEEEGSSAPSNTHKKKSSQRPKRAVNSKENSKLGVVDDKLELTGGNQVGKKRSTSKSSEKAAEAAIDKLFDWAISLGVMGLKDLYFRELSPYIPPGTCTAWEANRDKNRYQDIALLDDSRVKLTLNVPPCTDYIHASWLRFEGYDRVLIATQAPLENTCEDFWRMVFELNCQRVLCVTKMIDDAGKELCFQYFPDKPSSFSTFGKMFIQTKRVDKKEKEKSVIYTIEVLPEGCSNSLIVKVIQMAEWDKDDPNATRDTLSLIKSISIEDTLATGPIVLHCSGGVGRSATLILIDVLLCKIMRGNCDVVAIFKALRSQRGSAIQKPGQFIFAILCCLHYLSRKIPTRFKGKTKVLMEEFKKAADLDI